MLEAIAGFWIFWVFGAIVVLCGGVLFAGLAKRWPAVAASLATALVILGTFTACGYQPGR